MKTYQEWIAEHTFDDNIGGSDLLPAELARQIKMYASTPAVKTSADGDKVIATGPAGMVMVTSKRFTDGEYVHSISDSAGTHLRDFTSPEKIEMLKYIRDKVVGKAGW